MVGLLQAAMRYNRAADRRNGLDTLRIARDLSEGDVFSHEQAERLANAFATYWAEIRK
jgi:hypothetical protein